MPSYQESILLNSRDYGIFSDPEASGVAFHAAADRSDRGDLHPHAGLVRRAPRPLILNFPVYKNVIAAPSARP